MTKSPEELPPVSDAPHCKTQIGKDDLGSTLWIQGRLHSADSVQQVPIDDGFVCVACNKSQRVLTNKCSSCSLAGTLQQQFTKENMQDQRYIEIILEGNDPNVDNRNMDNADERKLWISLSDYDAWQTLTVGERVRAHGVIMAAESNIKPVVKNKKSYFVYMECQNIERLTETKRIELSTEDIQEFKEWAKTHSVDDLVDKFAIHIFGQSMVKEAILLQIVGADFKGLKQRGDIHVLVIGDPSEGKTELCLAACRITDGLYTSGEGISKVGIAAGLVKNEQTGRYVVEAGIAVLGNYKLKCLDEIDKMERDYTKQLYTVLDKGFYKLDKVKHAEFETRGAWLITGNPKNGKYDEHLNIAQNISFSPPLLSRFDLIFILRRTYEADKTDKRLAAINARYDRDMSDDVKAQETWLAKYLLAAKSISAAKMTIEPGVFVRLTEFYHKLERSVSDDTIPITERQYEGMLRLAIARAKLCLRINVTVDDANRSIEIMTKMMSTVAVDVESGATDFNVVNRGISKGENDKDKIAKSILQTLNCRTVQNEISEAILIEAMKSSGLWGTDDECKAYIAKLRADGVLQSVRGGYYFT